MRRPAVTVVGLGPGDPGLVTAATLDAIDAHDVRFLRTARHPSAGVVGGAVSFDDAYESGETFDDVYASIVDRLVESAGHHGRVLYAVPGSPRVLERTVELLVARDGLDVDVLPALSFLDLAWVRLGIDPVELGVRLVDGHTFATSAAGEQGPLLVAHCHNQRVLSDIKLAVDEPPDTSVTVIQRLGLPDERILTVTWAELDRAIEADHLTSLYVPQLGAPVAGELVRFDELVHTLRRECPWDREQTHASLRRHLIEEAYEVVEAIDDFDPATGEGAEALEEELGDLLFQVFFHSVLAAEEGWFELADVARTVHDKLHARHPHVFGDDSVAGTDELIATWEARKLTEKGRASVMDGVPAALPALSYAEKTIKKASAIDLPMHDDLLAGAAAALQAVTAAPGDDTVARALLALVALARGAGVDPEMALRAAARDAAERIRQVEAAADQDQLELASLTVDERRRLWQRTGGAGA